MPLPNLLIIGAMKAGTTSLYMDLARHPQVFFALDKEPSALASDRVLTPEGQAQYEANYAKASLDQVRCDASTTYSKRPDIGGVPGRAEKILPAGFKVIYLVRHPIDRIISQHHHEYFAGIVGPKIDEEVRRHARYVQYSRYNDQLRPWLELAGLDRIRVIRFEDYVNFRQDVVTSLCCFLGLPSLKCDVDESAVYNKSQGKPIKTKFWHSLQHNRSYRRLIRPLTSMKFRQTVRRLLLPKAATTLALPQPATMVYLHDALADDVRRLSETLAYEKPLWPGF